MNTNQRSISLQSGEALAVDGAGSTTLFLVEGQVLLQSAAQWLGGRVVLPPARRVTAPAALPAAGDSIMAVGTARIQVVTTASTFDKLLAALQGFMSAATSRLLRSARS